MKSLHARPVDCSPLDARARPAVPESTAQQSPARSTRPTRPRLSIQPFCRSCCALPPPSPARVPKASQVRPGRTHRRQRKSPPGEESTFLGLPRVDTGKGVFQLLRRCCLSVLHYNLLHYTFTTSTQKQAAHLHLGLAHLRILVCSLRHLFIVVVIVVVFIRVLALGDVELG